MKKIIGIGNALVDVLVRLEDDCQLSALGLPKGGMQLINDSQQCSISEKIAKLQPTRATGGSAGNAMLALANLGARPGFIGRIGDDETGDFFLDNCRSVGIDARLVRGEGFSGVANTFITPDAERTFATYLGAAAQLSSSDIAPELFKGYQLLHIEGYLVQNHELIEKVCRVAKELGRPVVLKVILETGLLVTPENIADASFLAMENGADFIKTSTGKVKVNATPLAAYVMCECIQKFYERTGKKVGFKAAGGIASALDAVCYWTIVKTILGEDWLNKDLFRFGVSSLANKLLSAVEQKTETYF